jgi:hypothetical protein
MGFGMVAGLVAFQFLLMANALGALWRYQRAQLSAPAPGDKWPGTPKRSATWAREEAELAAPGAPQGTNGAGGA